MNPLTYTVVLAAVLVSLQQATTYLIPLSTLLLLVPVGLVLTLVAALPVTVVLGLLADRAQAKRTPGPADERRARLQQAFRPLGFATPAAWSVVQIKSAWESSPPPAPSTSSNSSPSQSRPTKRPVHPATPYFLLQPIDALFTRIIDEFVLSWFVKISPSPAFPNEIENTIRHSLANILARVETTDLPNLVVSKIIPQITNHLLSFSNAEHSLRVAGKHSSTTEGLDLFLSQAYGPNTLHPAVAGNTLDTKPAQEEHMRGLVEGILKLVLPAKESRSRAVLIVAREIVTSAVLMPVLEMMSDPDFWNKMLDEKASNYIREQNLVHQLRAALDQSLPTSASPAQQSADGTARKARPSRQGISVKTDTKAFESFVKGIGKVDDLMDLRRLRSDLGGEIRKTKGSLDSIHAGVAPTHGEKAEDLRSHLERLYLARAKAERRISHLGGDGMSSNESSRINSTLTTTSQKVNLHSILVNPSSLSYFMEFMERRNKILLVQFWLTVESFKDPLEDIDADLDPGGQDSQLGGRDDDVAGTAREDLRGVWEVYFEDGILGEDIAAVYGDDIRTFITGTGATGMARARRSMFLAQRQVYKQIDDDFFPLFRTSDLYFKAAAHVAATTSAPPPLAPSIPHPPSFPHRQTTGPLINHPPYSSPNNPSTPKFARSPLAPSPEGRTLPRLTTPSAESPSPTWDRKAAASEPYALPPHFHRAQTWTAQPTTSVVKLDHDGPSPVSTSAGRAGLRSPPVSSQLDFLMSSDSDISSTRAPLFDEVAGPSQGLGIALDPNGDEANSEDEDYIQVRRLDAIQAALTSIIAKDQSSQPSSALPPSRSQGGSSSRRVASQASLTHSLDSLLSPPEAASPTTRWMDRGSSHSPTASPKTASTSDPELAPRRRVFSDAGGHEETAVPFRGGPQAAHDDEVDPEEKIQFAAPGDLQLPSEIARLRIKLDKLQSQEPILDALIRKAELTGSEDELQILNRSHSGLLREIRALSFQKSQYEQQELENRLDPRRTKIAIPTSTSVDEDGKQVVRYLVEVQQAAPDGAFAHGWVVARRYNEFFSLHHDLREAVPATRPLVLPGKMLVTSMSSSFVDSRRTALEKYLQSLLSIESACNSPQLRAFLSQHTSQTVDLAEESAAVKKGPSYLPQNLVKSIYRTVATGLDESLSAGPSMLDVIGQRLTRQAGEFATLAGLASAAEDGTSQSRTSSSIKSKPDAPDLLDLPPELKPLEGETASSYFTAPICDLFVEIFELKENNWLRRQAIVIILQQLLGGAIERKLRDVSQTLTGPASILKYITSFSDALWPGGVKRPPSIPRTDEQKRRTKHEANKKITSLMPDVASNMIGRSNARRGARRLFAVVQNQRLNQHLVHTIVDEVIFALFPELIPSKP